MSPRPGKAAAAPRPSLVTHPSEDVDGLPSTTGWNQHTLKAELADNIDIFDFALTEEEMARINALPQKPYHAIPDEPPAFVTTPMDYSKQS